MSDDACLVIHCSSLIYFTYLEMIIHMFDLPRDHYWLRISYKGGVAVTEAVKILALPRRGGGGGLTPAKIFLVDMSQCTEANLK